jgi:hypothetical protein
MAPDHLDLSILEFGYTRSDGRLRSGLEFTLTLAQIAEACGYARFWHTEHHDANLQIACPEVVITAVAANTHRIRVGAAGILLNYYSPFKVAENSARCRCCFPIALISELREAPVSPRRSPICCAMAQPGLPTRRRPPPCLSAG